MNCAVVMHCSTRLCVANLVSAPSWPRARAARSHATGALSACAAASDRTARYRQPRICHEQASADMRHVVVTNLCAAVATQAVSTL